MLNIIKQTRGEDEGIAEENERNPCLEAKDLHVSGNVSSFYEYKECGGSKRKRDEHNGICETCVGSLDVLKNAIENFGRVFFENLEEVANERINASNEMMDKVMTQIYDLYGLTEDECLKAMSVIGRSAPLFHMFARLNEDGKVRMAQMFRKWPFPHYDKLCIIKCVRSQVQFLLGANNLKWPRQPPEKGGLYLSKGLQAYGIGGEDDIIEIKINLSFEAKDDVKGEENVKEIKVHTSFESEDNVEEININTSLETEELPVSVKVSSFDVAKKSG
ncbi:hypothetical protein Tco_0893406 [Tanacetum coccineum]|uniref:Uncharacterized protein n=1 Tax=Tanacetum coccineum TaxID=301880 RepID=A0ABQ5CF09_9ASTR